MGRGHIIQNAGGKEAFRATNANLAGISMAAIFLILKPLSKVPLVLAFVLLAVAGTLTGGFGI